MKLHANAALSLNQRRRLARRVVEQGWSLAEAARAAEVSERTVRKWVRRYRLEGERGLWDRSSAPHHVHNRTAEGRVELVAALRRVRFTGPQIAELLEMASSTVSAILLRLGLGKLSRLGPVEPPRRYEKGRPGELVHIDVKKLGRIVGGAGERITGRRKRRYTGRRSGPDGRRHFMVGYECVHICVDDATRLAFAEVLADERAATVVGFLRRMLAFYRSQGVTVERVMTDNGSAYVSSAFALACRRFGVKHCRTQPYRPRTNGKACVLASRCRPVGRRGSPRPVV